MLLRETTLMLVWFSLIYKENVLSYFLFIVVLIHTYRNQLAFLGDTYRFVQITVIIVFVI